MDFSNVPPVSARLCLRAAALTRATGIAFLVANTAIWLVPQWSEFAARMAANLRTEPITLTPAVRLLGLGITSLNVAALLWSLWTARTLFLRFAAGDVFRSQTGILLRRFGLALLVYAGLSPVTGAIVCLVVTMGNPAGQVREVGLALSDETVVLAVVGILLLVMGSVFAEAVRIAEENRQII